MKIFILSTIAIIIAIILIVVLKPTSVTPVVLDRMSATTNNPTKAFFPEPTNYVVDNTGKLSQDTIVNLNADLKSFDSTAQVAVVLVDTTSPESLEDYSIHLADKWKVGYKGLDNGVILLVAVGDRKIRIEVGRGVEDKLTDAEAGRIINNVIAPRLKAGDWDGGITGGVDAIKNELK